MDDTADVQNEVLAFLGEPRTYGGAPVERIDTHVASVFLAGERALKIKRAVRFPFLDFTTLAGRKAACEAELAVNKPYAPQIYRGVVAITRAEDGGLAIGGNGEPVEWAVEMRRFDETRTLDHLAAEIDETLADALGRAVAAAHAKAKPVDAAPWIAALGGYIDEHVEAFRRYPDIFAAAENDALARASRAAYERIVPLLEARGRSGLIRRIHGDLHLGNIALIDGEPVLFDAIEFSDVIASGDVLYDLAFLLMDLVERGLALAANIVFNRYLAETRRTSDLDALAALPFFLSMRAAIRAEVTAARMERASPAERPGIAASARAYFAFARRAIAPPDPKLIAIGGLSGTGKTQLARALAPQVGPMPGAVIVRSDVRAQSPVRRRRNRQTAAACLCRGGQRPRLWHASRQSAPHPHRPALGDRRWRVRTIRGAARTRRGGGSSTHSAARIVSHRRTRNQACPCRRAHARCLRCRPQGGKHPGGLRPWTARLEANRGVGNPGANFGARPRCTGLTRQAQTDIKRRSGAPKSPSIRLPYAR